MRLDLVGHRDMVGFRDLVGHGDGRSVVQLVVHCGQLFNRFAHSAGPWLASHMYHRFSCYEFCGQRHLDAHRTLPSKLCGLALPGSWPSSDPDNTREIVEQVKQHKDMGFQAPVVQAWKQHATTWSKKLKTSILLFFADFWSELG